MKTKKNKLIKTKPVGRDRLSPVYQKPTMEIIEMNLEQSILTGSGDNFNSGGGGGDW